MKIKNLEEYKEELKVIKNMVFHSLYSSVLNGIVSQNAFIKLKQDINAKFENYINDIEILETTNKGGFWFMNFGLYVLAIGLGVFLASFTSFIICLLVNKFKK